MKTRTLFCKLYSNLKPKNMTYLQLIEKAKKDNKEQQFIELLEEEPMYPIEHTDHEVPEFGCKIEFKGSTNETGIKQNEEAYVLGIARHKPNVGRLNGWMEVLFFDGSVYGLFFDDVNFI